MRWLDVLSDSWRGPSRSKQGGISDKLRLMASPLILSTQSSAIKFKGQCQLVSSSRESMSSLMIDTGPLVALTDWSDPYHRDCGEALAGIADPLGTVWPVLTAAMYLLRLRTSAARAVGHARCSRSS